MTFCHITETRGYFYIVIFNLVYIFILLIKLLGLNLARRGRGTLVILHYVIIKLGLRKEGNIQPKSLFDF